MEQEKEQLTEQTPATAEQAPAAAAEPVIVVAQPKKKRKKWPFVVLAIVVLLGVGFWRLARKAKTIINAVQMEYTVAAVEQRTIVRKLSGSGTLKPANSYTVTTLIEGNILTADFEEGDTVDKDTVLYEMDSATAQNSIEQAERSLEQAELNLASAKRNLSQSQRSYTDASDKQYLRADADGMLVALNVRVGDKISAGQSIGTIRDSAVMSVKVPFPSDDALNFYVGQDAVIVLDNSFETLYGTVKEISAADTVGTGNMLTRNVTVEVVNPGALTTGQAASVSIAGVNGSSSATFTYRGESTVVSGSSGTVTEIMTPEGSAVTKDQVLLTLGGSLSDSIQSAADSVENSSGSVRNAELSLENSRIALENARKKLDDYTIRSPIGGTVVEKLYKAGDKVSAGKSMCTIYDLSYLEMTLNVDELDISAVKVGQGVNVTTDAVEGKRYSGIVTRVSVAGTTTNGTTSYPVTIRIDETDGLLPGMNVDAEIVLSSAENALSIPNAAVNRRKTVLVTADSPSAAAALPDPAPAGYAYVQVETGISDDDYVQVLSGLTEGDTVAYIPASNFTFDFGMMGGPGGMGGGPMG